MPFQGTGRTLSRQHAMRLVGTDADVAEHGAFSERAFKSVKALSFSNLLIGFLAACFLLGTYGALGLAVDVPLVVLGFCGAFLVYCGERGFGGPPEDTLNHPARLAWIHEHSAYWRSALLTAAVVSVMMLPRLHWQTLLAGAALAGVSLLYGVPLLRGGRRLKSVWWAKPLLIGGGWALGGVLLPVIESGRGLPPAALWLLLFRFLFLMPNALLADLPDRLGDAQSGLLTPVLVLGATRIRMLALVSIGGAVALALAGPQLGLLSPLVRAEALACIPATFIVWGVPKAFDRRHMFVLDLLVAWPLVSFLLR